MLYVLLEMTALIAFGAIWAKFSPKWLDAEQLRFWLTKSVFYVFLPALVLKVLWSTALTTDSLRLSATAISGVIFALALTHILYRFIPIGRAAFGAILLASIFPNVTYMGLPVLDALYGEWVQSVAIQYDLFGTLPLVFTLGIALASRYSPSAESRFDVTEFLRIPAVWAAALALGLQALGSTPVASIMTVLEWLAVPVAPFMLFAVGLSLKLKSFSKHRLLILSPVMFVQFIAVPLFVWGFGANIGLQGEWLQAVVLEAAMPAMVLGIVLCDRYQLDSRLFATAVTVTTASTIVIIPLWFNILQI